VTEAQPTLEEEREWTARARGGDREAIALLYRAFAARLYTRVLLPKLGFAAAAEDALAETWKSALERLPDYRDEGRSIYAWLSTIAASKAMDMHRGRARSSRVLASFEALIGPLRPSSPTPLRELESNEELEAVRHATDAALERLNPRYREVLRMRFWEEASRQECAARLEVKEATFDVLLLRALRAFQREWDALLSGQDPMELP
jgi:RNA polymerase sigma-70 factor, ECF subfamily